MDTHYFFGTIGLINGTEEAVMLGAQMRDYWISFAVSLDPNDGLGTDRKSLLPSSSYP